MLLAIGTQSGLVEKKIPSLFPAFFNQFFTQKIVAFNRILTRIADRLTTTTYPMRPQLFSDVLSIKIIHRMLPYQSKCQMYIKINAIGHSL